MQFSTLISFLSTNDRLDAEALLTFRNYGLNALASLSLRVLIFALGKEFSQG